MQASRRAALTTTHRSTQWRVVNPSSIVWATWDQGHAIFCGETGETHLLSELPALLLELLAEGPVPEGALCSMVAEQSEIAVDDAWRRKIQRVLGDLADLELVEKIGQTNP